ncbi:unnamed protein product [Euphydryas editha]|uniref:HTH psq-type domain-containing protein n=1 Tax=Euphydryas editha TaxID=104508 RepID=A0AAU9TLC9_EUPED|nr:unnamed protein product [Euphydryas editha]
MPTEYNKKTDRGMASRDIYELAAEEVTRRQKSLRNAASSYNLNHISLYRYIKNKKAYESDKTVTPPSVGYQKRLSFHLQRRKN